ncbi:hypothetical protein E3N88_35949 [Mikania micrantha]|uniref:Uncharacterized protein n=1 Tax=Mikania micrantha TaxID=192012 RepID=A0A5N6M2D0_9ASTR|nr:hypothetical protein E3N88_35949 [Mikania micrantha]
MGPKKRGSGEGTGLLRLLQHDLEAYSCKMGSVYTEDPKSFLLEMAVSYGPNLSLNSIKLAWKVNEPAPPCEWKTRHDSGTIAYLDSTVKVLDCFASTNMTLRLIQLQQVQCEGTGLLRLLQHELEAYSCKMGSVRVKL